MGSSSFEIQPSNQFHSMNALDILRETVRILRFNSTAFVGIALFLISPVSALFLSNALLHEPTLNILTTRLLSLATSSGLPLLPITQLSCHTFAQSILSSVMCFPLFLTLSLLSKAAVVYTVNSTYANRMFVTPEFLDLVRAMWVRLLSTYASVCLAVVGCLTMFLLLLSAVCSAFYVLGFSPALIVSVAVILGLVFSVVFAYAVIVCNVAVVVCVLEEFSGPAALLRSLVLVKGRAHVGLLIYLGSTIGAVFVEGLFEHRVNTLSYGDGSSRIWEGPLLVLMYSFVLLTDSMMSVVFYFSCRSPSMGVSNGEGEPVLDIAVSDGSAGVP